MRLRINLLFGGAVLLLVPLVYLPVQSAVRAKYLEHLESELTQQARLMSRLLAPELDLVRFDDSPSRRRLAVRLREIAGLLEQCRLTVIDPDGVVLADSDADGESLENHRFRAEVTAARERGIGTAIRFSESVSRKLFYLALHADPFVLRIARGMDRLDGELAVLTEGMLKILLMIVAVLLLLNFLVAWLVTRPLAEIARFARGYRDGALAARIPVRRDDEVGLLASTINDMAENIESLVGHIRAEKARLEHVIRTITEALVLVDRDGQIRLVNDAFRVLFPGRSEAIGKAYYRVIDSNQLTALIGEALADGKTRRVEIELVRNESLVIDTALLPMEERAGLLVVIRDVTERRRFEKEKSVFFSNASHELKTPLSIIGGYVETLLDDPGLDQEKRTGFLGRIAANVERLSLLVQDLATLDKLEQGGRYFPLEGLDLRQVLEEVLESLAQRAAAKQITIDRSFPAESCPVAANPQIIESLFFNLIDNALKYTTAGGAVSVRLEAERDVFLVGIRDNGVGFPPENAQRLFERFYRVDGGRSRASGGTGLGLSIVRHAAEFHGGTVSATSSGPGAGACFTVRLPRRAPGKAVDGATPG